MRPSSRLTVEAGRASTRARELLEQAAVDDVSAEPKLEAFNLIAAATRRELSKPVAAEDAEAVRAHRDARVLLEQLDDSMAADAAAEALLGWLQGRFEERG